MVDDASDDSNASISDNKYLLRIDGQEKKVCYAWQHLHLPVYNSKGARQRASFQAQ